MFSLSKSFVDCGIDNHYKIGKAINSSMKEFPQWVYFVVQDEVESFPPLKEFIGPLIAGLEGEAYGGDKTGTFSKQAFLMSREGKQVMGQVLNIVHFAEFVRNKQGVSEQFWEVLSPVVGASKFNFHYLGEAKSPNRLNQKHVARRGYGKSRRKSIVQEEEESREEIEEERPCKKGKKAPPPEAFVWDQPIIRLKRHRLVKRCKKWFERNHPFVKMDQGQDLFPAECAKAAADAAVPEGEGDKKPRAKKIPAGQPGSQARRECNLNKLYDLEKVGRTAYVNIMYLL